MDRIKVEFLQLVIKCNVVNVLKMLYYTQVISNIWVSI